MAAAALVVISVVIIVVTTVVMNVLQKLRHQRCEETREETNCEESREETNSSQGGSGCSSDQISYIPEWFLRALFGKLSVKDVLRLKRVSREWRSVISAPCFRSFYISRKGFAASRLICFPYTVVDLNPKYKLRFADGDATGIHQPKYFQFSLPNRLRERLPKKGPILNIRAADDKGFVLVESKKQTDTYRNSAEFYICNIFTSQCIILPEVKPLPQEYRLGLITQSKDGVLTSYKVILIEPKEKLLVLLLSSETGRWDKLMVNIQRRVQVQMNWYGTLVVDNKFYWDVKTTGGVEPGILAYDPYLDLNDSHFINLPPLGVGERRLGSSFVNSQDQHLKFFETLNKNGEDLLMTIKIWELEDNHQWRLEHTIQCKDILYRDDKHYHLVERREYAQLASFHPLDRDVIYLYWGLWGGICHLVSYNIRTRRMELVYKNSNGEPTKVRRDLFFRAIPLWPISIPDHLMSRIGSVDR